MIVTKPIFYADFKCSAGNCTDSCCVGWEIDIDDLTLAKYNNFKGVIKNKLKSNISTDGNAHFVLTEDERCPFLNPSNLCELILNCSESALCDICREHPRFYEWYGKYKDEGVGLCCEESCKLLFGSHDKLKFLTEETDEEEEEEVSDLEAGEIEAIRKLRRQSFDIVNDREYHLSERIKLLLKFVYNNTNRREYNFQSKAEYYKSVIVTAKCTEPFDDNFIVLINSLEKNLDLILQHENEFQRCKGFYESDYERLLCYFLFRWQIKAIYGGSISNLTEFCTGFLTFTYLTDLLCFLKNKVYTKGDRINNVKYLSKQFEYSDINPKKFIKNISKQEK